MQTRVPSPARARTRRPAVAGLAGLVSVSVAALALSGCSGDSDTDQKDKDAKASSKASASASVDPAKVSPADLPVVPEVKGSQGAVADATFGACATSPGKTSVTGSLTSSAKKSRDYVVTVSWVNATSDVLGRGVHVARNVEPQEKREFAIKATVPRGATTCTFQVLRGSVR